MAIKKDSCEFDFWLATKIQFYAIPITKCCMFCTHSIHFEIQFSSFYCFDWNFHYFKSLIWMSAACSMYVDRLCMGVNKTKNALYVIWLQTIEITHTNVKSGRRNGKWFYVCENDLISRFQLNFLKDRKNFYVIYVFGYWDAVCRSTNTNL